MPRPRPWTDDQLRTAVGSSASLLAVCRALGLEPGGRTYEQLRRHIARLDLDTSHMSASPLSRLSARRRITDEQLAAAVREGHSFAHVIRALGSTPSGGMHRYVRARISVLGLDIAHFVGRGWARGRRFPDGARARPLEEILVAGSLYPSGRLRRRLIDAGLKPARCEICGIDTWRDAPMPLELDHVNGDPSDNRLSNLRILCPNCHSQTETWCSGPVRR